MHLGYGNIGTGTSAYSPDGFKELFDEVISVYLTGSTETTTTTSATAGATTTITPASMTGIVAHAQLVIDVAEAIEVVSVRAVTATTFTAYFAKAHTGTYPVALMGGYARLRLLLHRAEQAWTAMFDPSVGATAGLKQVDKGDVEWFAPGSVIKDRLNHYRSIVMQISSLVRVPPRWANEGHRTTLEAY